MPSDNYPEIVCACDDFPCIQRKIFAPINRNAFYKHILASMVGSIVSVVTINPITVVKIKIQNVPNSLHAHSSIRSIIRSIVKDKGIFGFYAGTPMGIIMAVPSTVLYMTAYEEVKVKLNKKMHSSAQYKHLVPGIAGAMARFFSVTITTPLELIRTIQTGGSDKSILQVAREIVKQRGPLGLFSGWGANIMRDCPFSAIYWYLFETLRPIYTCTFCEKKAKNDCCGGCDCLTEEGRKAIPRPTGFAIFPTFLAGASSGMLAALVTHPYDVVKTQRQMAVLSSTTAATTAASGVSNIIANTVRESLGRDTLVSMKPNPAGMGGSTTMVLNCGQNHAHSIPSPSSSLSSASTVTEAVAVSAARRTSGNIAVDGAAVTLRCLYTTGGISALYRGLSMRLVSVIPASAIMVTIYEKIKSVEL